MWDFFIRRNRFSYLLVVSLIVLGLYSLAMIPRESSPEVEVPVGVVTTILPGANATDVESLVTNEIERGLSGLTNVVEITSTSQTGQSSVTVEFDASADLDTSIQDLNEAVDRIAPQLPANAEEPRVQKIDFVNQPIVTVVIASDRPTELLANLADDVSDELEDVAGVSRVVVNGVPNDIVDVVVDPQALARYNISLPEITNAIQRAGSAAPIGTVRRGDVNYSIAFSGEAETADDLADVVVATSDTATVYLRDIASVREGLAPVTTKGRLSVDGSPARAAVSFDVFKQQGGDITRIAAAVNDRIAELQQDGELLEDVSVTTLLDSGEQIQDDLIQLATSGGQTVLLVILFLMIAIGWREGLIAGTAIPLSFLFGFIGLYLSGNTINFLSLFSLILGIGVLVDAAIVMVEGINRRMKENPNIDKEQAAIDTIRTFAVPLTAGTLTTVAMFVGLFIVSGVTGQFIASIPFTIIFLLFAALFVALAIIPLFAALMLKRRSLTTLEKRQTEYARALEQWYKNKLSSILGDKNRERRVLWSFRIALIAVLALPITGIVPVVFFATDDSEYIIVEARAPEGTALAATESIIVEVESALYNIPEIKHFQTTIGRGSQFASGGTNEKYANIFITLNEDRERTSSEISTELRNTFDAIGGADISISQLEGGPPTGSPISIRFIGDDIEALTALATRASVLARQTDGTTNVQTSADSAQTEYVLTYNRDVAGYYGIDPAQLSSIVRTAVFGTEATTFTSLSDERPVIVSLDIGNQGRQESSAPNVSISELGRMSIPTSRGAVPLSTLASIDIQSANSAIAHIDGERVVTLTSDVTSDANPRTVEQALRTATQDTLDVDADITIETGGGESEESNRAFREMFVALIVGVLLMVAILTLQFNSFRHTRYVLSILPYSLIGILSGLALTGNALSFPSMMGFIALSGIVVNNSILLIDMMNRMRAEFPHRPLTQTVIEAAANRLRPILLTTITTVLGMIPLLYADPIWAPLAYSVMFGLIFSVAITLVLIPVIYNRNPGKV